MKPQAPEPSCLKGDRVSMLKAPPPEDPNPKLLTRNIDLLSSARLRVLTRPLHLEHRRDRRRRRRRGEKRKKRGFFVPNDLDLFIF